MRRAYLAWAAIVLPVWSVFVLCTHWEPILRDGWGHFIWHRHNDVGLASVWEFAKNSYTHNNPRLGQVLTLLQHTPGPWHSIATPLVELALFYLLAALALGRWPSLRRAEDALLYATIVALAFACVRSLGPMLFYRPFTGNYLFGFVLNLIWLVPYRFHAAEPRRRGWWWIPIMLVLGVASGLANEHTGPALVGAVVLALAVYWRRGERFVPWALAGLAGMIAGGLALLFAPGQDIRYHGLATQASTLDRMLDRGAEGTGKILLLAVIYMLPAVLWLALGAIGKLRRSGSGLPRGSALALLACAGVALAIVITLLASPKQGDRLYFASICLCCASVAGWVTAQLGRVERWIAVALAAVAIAYASVRLLVTYHRFDREFSHRYALIEKAPKLTVIAVPQYSHQRSRWAIGDDFIGPHLRGAVSVEFGLDGIELEPQRDATAPPPVKP